MGFRTRKSFSIAPGVKLNVSKTGFSTSVGTRGASVNFGRGRSGTTIGIPGTGISHVSSRKGGGGAAIFVMIVAAIVWWFL